MSQNEASVVNQFLFDVYSFDDV